MNCVQLPPLLVHDVSHIAEKFIEFPDRLFDIPNFRFPLDNQRLLEVDFVLRSEA